MLELAKCKHISLFFSERSFCDIYGCRPSGLFLRPMIYLKIIQLYFGTSHVCPAADLFTAYFVFFLGREWGGGFIGNILYLFYPFVPLILRNKYIDILSIACERPLDYSHYNKTIKPCERYYILFI